MEDTVYKQVELVGSSTDSIEAAVEGAIARASTTVRNMRWFEVKSVRGGLEDDRIAEWQVTVSVAFALD